MWDVVYYSCIEFVASTATPQYMQSFCFLADTLGSAAHPQPFQPQRTVCGFVGAGCVLQAPHVAVAMSNKDLAGDGERERENGQKKGRGETHLYACVPARPD